MWKLLPLLALPLTRGIATFPTSDEICIEASTGMTIRCEDLEQAMIAKGEEWDCDIRAWTRAPDLIPGHSIPAETRLNMNGTGCVDVVGWEVGLRLKERSIIKIRRDDVEFPKKPERKPYNHTANEVDMEDWNDIYRGRYGSYYGHSGEDLEYEDQMEVYNIAIRNKSLFHVDGREMVLFDEKLTMELPVHDGGKPIDHMRAFSIDVPLTNFPPIKAYEGSMGSSGKDEQMINTETMFEYYHLLTLNNGTILDIPAGRSGFLTEPQPTSLHSDVRMDWPVVISLDSPRKKNESAEGDDDIWGMGRHNQGPACDAGNKAEFEMMITSDSRTITPEKNITLTIHLARKGNGSEYPAFLDISLTTYQNQSFAYSYPTINSRQAYNDLIREDDNYRPGGIDTSYPQKMLLVRSQESLERQRQEANQYGMVSMSGSGRWPVQRGEVRYDFEEVHGKVGDKEEYEFEVEFPIPYNVYPNFETVFTTLTPQLSFSLQTTFTCSKPVTSTDPEAPKEDDLDNQWEEWRLPTKRQSSYDSFNSYALNHRGYTNLVIRRESNLSPAQQGQMKHYLDPTAYAPALSKKVISKTSLLDPESELKTVSQNTRMEEENELKQSRYDLYASGRQYTPRCMNTRQGGDPSCWNKNNGGGGKHAAKLWQRKEEEAKGNNKVDDEVVTEGGEGQVVYQVRGVQRYI